MKTPLIAGLLSAAVSTLLVAGSAYGTTLPVCQTSDVTVTSISIAGGAQVTPVGFSADAAECTGAYIGNAIPLPHLNLGYYGDGLFNGESHDGQDKSVFFPDGIFSSQYTATDLNGDGITDPGWIYLGYWGAVDNSWGFHKASIGGVDTIVLDSWFNVTGTGSSGTWSFTPDADVVARATPVVGENLFDQFALSFMAGDRFAAYDFTGAQFGIPISPDTIFNFSGTWDMSDTLINNGGRPAALSHVDLYVRDPNGSATNVPEPASITLIGIALAGLALSRRNKA